MKNFNYRRLSPSEMKMALILAAIVLVAGVIAVILLIVRPDLAQKAEALVFGTQTPMVTSAPLTATAPVSVDGTLSDIQVYFTNPQNPDDPSYHTGGIDARLVEKIDKAKQTIDIAAFQINLETVADALIRAHERGVKVRIVTDTDYVEEDVVVKMKKAGIPVVDDQREAFMHNKFVVIDKSFVVTGSWNLTDNCTYRNNNNALFITSTDLAADYTTEFEEMFVDKQFGGKSPANTPHPVVTVDGIRIEVYYAPEDDVFSHVLPVVESGKKSIYFLAFSFTYDDLRKAIVDKQKAGLVIQGVVEDRNADGTGSSYPDLRRAKVDVLKDGNPYNLHDKVIIVDESIVITGSFNFSNSAQDSNDENLLIIYSPQLAAQYLAEFQKLYQLAKANN
jgi:phosphatidylserine/phosphatidylglycerophosphate/cardiolipin synthase-like enzyme